MNDINNMIFIKPVKNNIKYHLLIFKFYKYTKIKNFSIYEKIITKNFIYKKLI